MTKKFESLSEAQIGFALELLKIQHNDKSSTVFSPVSLSISMAMIYLGAQGNTAKQISDTLAEGFNESEIQEFFSALLERIKGQYAVKEASESEIEYNCGKNPYSSWPILETVNRAYINEKLIIKPHFVEEFDKIYQGGMEKVNFEEATTVAQKINDFVAEVTRKNIENVVTENDFDAETSQIILINAIYFKGRWNKQFFPRNTKNANFYSAPGKTKKVKMMRQSPEEWRYSESSSFQFLSLHYMHSDLSMKILLPKEKFGLAEVLTNLSAKELMEHLTKKDYPDVVVKIPKFDIKTQFNAKDTLENMGIKELFESDSNLEGLTDIKPTWLSSVLHSAFICIDEEGTEAGAMTAGDLRGCGLDFPPPPPKPIKFTADHPFMYFITDKQNNIYFCGTVTGAEFSDTKSISLNCFC